ncbi:DEAD/DEAH box helicase [bacterium]|nr:DEAD/DEAH box helicase [bacterium]
MNFQDLKLCKTSLEFLEDLGFKVPTAIQSTVIPLVLKGQNICGRSPTGSGKTHAFLLPILEKIDLNSSTLQALILVPTRELARQIFEMLKPFCKAFTDLRVQLLVSGSDRQKSIEELKKNPHIIIGTPGRVTDLAFDAALFAFTNLKICVLDEADMILESGFLPELGQILGVLKETTQILCFSASLPEQLLHFLNKYVRHLQYINLAGEAITAPNVSHIAYPTRHRDRLEILDTLLKQINPYLALIFASRKENVVKIYQYLLNKNYDVAMIHGDLSATSRRTTMKRIRAGRYPIVVASDMAARGLDLEGVSQVINYDLPYEEDFYFHRAGRTGRHQATGLCYTLYDKDDLDKLLSLSKRGVDFLHQELVEGRWQELKPLVKKRPTKRITMDSEIQKVISRHKKGVVKPNYKKKLKQEIDEIKRKQRRAIIKKDIQRQKNERYRQVAKQKKESQL